jgi:hypothetical protein
MAHLGQSAEEIIIQAVKRLEHSPGSSVTFYRLRQELSQLPRKMFDLGILSLGKSGKVELYSTKTGYGSTARQDELQDQVVDPETDRAYISMSRYLKSVKIPNPGLGRRFYFFGKFKSLILARRKEREHPHSFIVQKRGYYYVVKERKNPLKSRHGTRHLKCPVCGKGTIHFVRGKPIHKTCYSKLSQVRTLKPNPRTGTLIYGRVLKIFAQKTSGPYKGQRFVHTFKKGAIMLGMPDGTLRITHP